MEQTDYDQLDRPTYDLYLERRNAFVDTVLNLVVVPDDVIEHLNDINRGVAKRRLKGKKIPMFDDEWTIFIELRKETKIRKYDMRCYCCPKFLFDGVAEKTYVSSEFDLDHGCFHKRFKLYCKDCFTSAIAASYISNGLFSEESYGYEQQNDFYTHKHKEGDAMLTISAPLKPYYILEEHELRKEDYVLEIMKLVDELLNNTN